VPNQISRPEEKKGQKLPVHLQLSNPQASTQAALASSKAREHHELLCNKSAARVATAPPAGCCWVAKGHGNAAAGEAEGIPSLSPHAPHPLRTPLPL